MTEQMFLMVKRDLYEMPDHCGYTGVKDRAGRYTLAECAEAAPNKYSPLQDGWYIIAEDDAPEYTNKCFWDTREAHLKEKLYKMQSEIEQLRDALSEIATYPWQDHTSSHETTIIAGLVSTAKSALHSKEADNG